MLLIWYEYMHVYRYSSEESRQERTLPYDLGTPKGIEDPLVRLPQNYQSFLVALIQCSCIVHYPLSLVRLPADSEMKPNAILILDMPPRRVGV